jgi:hypothetical protein
VAFLGGGNSQPQPPEPKDPLVRHSRLREFFGLRDLSEKLIPPEFCSYLPLGWIYTCTGQGLSWITNDLWRGLLYVLISSFVFALIHSISCRVWDVKITVEPKEHDQKPTFSRQVLRILGTLIALWLITSMISRA